MINLVLDEKAGDLRKKAAMIPSTGARPMRRAVERFMEDPLAEEILRANLSKASRSKYRPTKTS